MSDPGQEEQRLRRLLEAGRALVSELELEPLLERLLDVARELTGARYAALGILSEGREELARFITAGIDADTHRAIGDLPRGRGILGELIRQPRPLRLSDIDNHPRSYGFPPGHPPMRTFLGVPVLVRGETWGNLYLTEKEGGDFTPQDEESLVVLAAWATVAVANAGAYGATQGQRDQLARAVRGFEAATEIANALRGETELERVLELIAKRGRALVEARSMLILLREGDDLVVTAAAGEVGDAVHELRIGASGSAPGQVLASGRSERVADLRSRAGMRPGPLSGAAAALMVPLSFRGRRFGVIVALDRLERGPQFSAEDERLLSASASVAATAVATAQGVESERVRKSLEGAEQERRRWARELHDDTLQGLASLTISLDAAAARDDIDAMRTAVVRARQAVEGEIEKVRAIITDLRPGALDELGIQAALGALAEQMARRGLEAVVEIDLDDEQGRAPTRHVPEIETTIYRLVQEALTNAAKHSGASSARVEILERDEQLTVEVRDAGVGFDPTAPAGGFGLAGMRERVALVAGALEIESESGAGTTVRATLPARRRLQPFAVSAGGHSERRQSARPAIGRQAR